MMNIKNKQLGLTLLLLIAVLTVMIFGVSDPIPQDTEYHNFSDSQTYFAIPNALNVLSNIPFLLIGVLGVIALGKTNHELVKIVVSNRFAYLIFFAAIAGVGVGSAYYHLWPNNTTLVWDRLPITMGFMSLYSIIITEFISPKWGKILLAPLLALGIFSVLYWWGTEASGAGDLRLYAAVQFFPILTIPVILICFKSAFNMTHAYWVLLFAYLIAKIFEHYDQQVHEVLVLVSGHTLKHIIPALGIYYLFSAFKRRTKT